MYACNQVTEKPHSPYLREPHLNINSKLWRVTVHETDKHQQKEFLDLTQRASSSSSKTHKLYSLSHETSSTSF